MEDWQREALLAVLEESLEDDPVALRARYVQFHSSGHEVIIVDGSVMFQVKRGEVKSRKKKDGYLGVDRVAQEILSHLPQEDQSPQRLLEIVREHYSRRKKLGKT
ncbi:MAG: hypothetical protein A2391_02635 [Candidatus Brennerbacteria bacterium RIFOXYB1_FULL_41_13]|nr:MAG: hypothetical protein A2391_02635 [Candidatus Brennerbacteria bacterium RIFOXYB1_FULL_41_13]